MIKINEQINSLSSSFLKTILIAILFSILTLFLFKISIYSIFIPIYFILFLIYEERFLIFSAIVSFLVITSTISIELRTIVQFGNIFILFFLFIKRFGLNFIEYPKVPKLVLFLIAMLYAAMIISTVFSDFIFLGVKEILRLTAFLLIVYFFFALIKSTVEIKLYLVALLATAIIYSIFIFYGFAQNDFSLVKVNLEELQKVNGNYLNMNAIGSFLMISISILLSFYLGTNLKSNKKLLFGAIIIFSSALIITNSRAAILATALSSIYILFKLNKRLLKIFSIAALFIIPLLFINPISDYIDIYLRLEKLSTGRDYILDVIYKIIKDNFILGVGPAATKFAIYPHMDFMLGTHAERFLAFHYNEIEFGHAHNFYLFFWSDLGLLGLFTSILLPIVFFKMCIKAIRKTKKFNPDYNLLSIGILGAGIGLFIRAFFEWGNLISYGTIGVDLPFWLLMVILSYINIKDISPNENILSKTVN